jgi:hypothetical protein
LSQDVPASDPTTFNSPAPWQESSMLSPELARRVLALWRSHAFRLSVAQVSRYPARPFGDLTRSGSMVLKECNPDHCALAIRLIPAQSCSKRSSFPHTPSPLLLSQCRPAQPPRPKPRDPNGMKLGHPMCHGRLVRPCPGRFPPRGSPCFQAIRARSWALLNASLSHGVQRRNRSHRSPRARRNTAMLHVAPLDQGQRERKATRSCQEICRPARRGEPCSPASEGKAGILLRASWAAASIIPHSIRGCQALNDIFLRRHMTLRHLHL